MSDYSSLLRQAQLYLCTDGRGSLKEFVDFADCVYEAGVDIIQLRDKGMEAGAEIEYLAALRELAERHAKLFAVNDRADIALLSAAPILHLGQGDLPLAKARELVSQHVLLGQSTHSLQQALGATQADTDYFCIGPVWPTATKPGRAAVGIEVVKQVAEAMQATSCHKPWFVIGDINHQTIREVVDAGVSRIVVVRAITQAPDPAESVYRLRQALPLLSHTE